MNATKLTKREIDEILQAIEIAERTKERLLALADQALSGDVDMTEVWSLRGYAEQVPAILYNVHHEIYRAVRS